MELRYLRDTDKREVDFLVTVDNVPWFACEVKLKADRNEKNLLYFQERLKIPFVFQVVAEEGVDHLINGQRIISASKFLTGLI
jgi:hypothetical protein